MPEVSLAPWQVAAVYSPFTHTGMYGGVATGKTATGSHFAIRMIKEFPEVSGFIGANSYDQLSQATLREFFGWLDHYGLEYIVDRRPPPGWKTNKRLKSYRNTMHVFDPETRKVTLIYTRTLSDGENLRGMEFTWYWIDETRDTPENTHDVILSRLRESKWIKGLITTTTNGEDWSYKRFVLGAKPGSRQYGSMHVPTEESVRCGLITPEFYNGLLTTYSQLLAEQELFAKHVNVLGGRAYHAAGSHNACAASPWGLVDPDPNEPLIVGCDFNFSPAPCVWMLGQLSPDGRAIHWFDELSRSEASTEDMTVALTLRHPDFFYRFFGDVSGGKGTTSNAGITDYDRISNVLSEAGYVFSIDYFQNEERQNPKVKQRVENMNALFKNAKGEVRQTYNPARCPLFHEDVKQVAWKQSVAEGRGKLSDGGVFTRTHATDGAGYAVYKLFPPVRSGSVIPSIPSSLRRDAGIAVAGRGR